MGPGFHPELTGRENIYLNGAILGMHRVEIQRRFDETCADLRRSIVAFAETCTEQGRSIERFLDTPVKRYSSGTIVRLAFAVSPPTWSRRFCLWMRVCPEQVEGCWRWGTRRFRRSVWGRWEM
jgi:ABC-type polysaccharide/polyol phosphate transport system ATPase subunit